MTLSLSLSLFLSLSLSLSLSFSLSLSGSQPIDESLSMNLSRDLSFFLSLFNLSLSLSVSLSHFLPFPLSLSPTLSLAPFSRILFFCISSFTPSLPRFCNRQWLLRGHYPGSCCSSLFGRNCCGRLRWGQRGGGRGSFPGEKEGVARLHTSAKQLKAPNRHTKLGSSFMYHDSHLFMF